MRNPGKRLLELAKQRVLFQPETADITLSRLTPDEELGAEFPRLDDSTPYGFFATTNNNEAVIRFTGTTSDEEKSRVILEAALGMRDNQLFD